MHLIRLVIVLFLILCLGCGSNHAPTEVNQKKSADTSQKPGETKKDRETQLTIPTLKNPFKETGEIVYPVEAVIYQRHFFQGKTISVFGKTKLSAGSYLDKDKILYGMLLHGRYGKYLFIYDEKNMARLKNRTVHEDVPQIHCIKEKGKLTCSAMKNGAFYKLKGEIKLLGDLVEIKIKKYEDIKEISPPRGFENLEEVLPGKPAEKIGKIIDRDSSPEAREFIRLAEQLKSPDGKCWVDSFDNIKILDCLNHEAIEYYSNLIDNIKKNKNFTGIGIKESYFLYIARVLEIENDGTYECAKGKGDTLIFVYSKMKFYEYCGPLCALSIWHERLVIFDKNKNVLCVFGDDKRPRTMIS